MQSSGPTWLERATSLLVASQLFLSGQSDFVTILAMSFVAGLGRYIVSINRRDADKIPTQVHQRVAALTAFMAAVLGFLLVGAQIGSPFVRVGLAGFISLLDQALARELLGRAVSAALPILSTFSSATVSSATVSSATVSNADGSDTTVSSAIVSSASVSSTVVSQSSSPVDPGGDENGTQSAAISNPETNPIQ